MQNNVAFGMFEHGPTEQRNSAEPGQQNELNEALTVNQVLAKLETVQGSIQSDCQKYVIRY